jgi:hypothetical protein
MNRTRTRIDLNAALLQMLGQHAWQARSGPGTFLRMNFGAPRVAISSNTETIHPRHVSLPVARIRRVRVLGDFDLWLYNCAWTLDLQGALVDSEASTPQQIEEAAHILDGQRMRSAVIRPDGSSCFIFDLGCTLATRPETPVDEQWMLFVERTDSVITLRGDGSLSSHPSNETCDPAWEVLTEEVIAHES